jgi:acetyl-CoA carboxylase/biotin carboxylase 1
VLTILIHRQPHVEDNFVALTWTFVVRNQIDISDSTDNHIHGFRTGLICAFDNVEDISFEYIAQILLKNISTNHHNTTEEHPNNILNVAVKCNIALQNDDHAHQIFEDVVRLQRETLEMAFIERVTFMVVQQDKAPRFFTFRESLNFAEDLIIRNTEPALSHKLELTRLQNFDIKSCFLDNIRIHIYHATAKDNPSDTRFFIRGIIHSGTHNVSKMTSFDFLMSEASRMMNNILDSIEILSAKYPNTDCNHVLLHFVSDFTSDFSDIENALRNIIRRNAKRLFKLRITESEIRIFKQRKSETFVRPHRIIVCIYLFF